MKKIIEIIPEFKLAGAETMCENLINAIDKKKYEIIAISLFSNKSPITERLEKNNIKIYYLNKKKGFDLKVFFKLCKIFKKEKPDMIHTHLYVMRYSLLPSILFSKKAVKVHTVHNIAEKEISKGKIIHKIAFKIFNVIPVAISEVVKESIIKTYKLNSNKVPLIYNGINLDNCIKKKNYKCSNTIIHIGRFSEQKNHVELIDIFNDCLKQNGKLKLLLIGDGEKKDEIHNYCKELGILKNVNFLGLQDNCYSFLNESDIFVMPSKWEGMPMTIIEAFGTGLPVVAYPVGGISDMIINEKNGFLPNNKKDFCNKILKLLEDNNLRKEIGLTNIKDSVNFSSKKMAELYCDLINSK